MRILKRALAGLVFVVALGAALLIWAIGPTTLRLIDPELLAGAPSGILAALEPAAGIAQREASGRPLRYLEKRIPGAPGDPPVRIVVVEPQDPRPGRAGVLDIHGGGFTQGSPESSLDTLVEELVLKLGITVMSVDYRLAPATRHAGALRDNHAALTWFRANARGMGVDPALIGIVGFSAGGAHAAALSLHLRDRGEPPALFQALLSPALDDRTGSTIDPGEALGHFLWTRDLNREAWTEVLGVAAGSDEVPAGAVPARAENLGGLPPTYIAVGSLDLFATESVEFARRLGAAGVPVQLDTFPGGFHAFEALVPQARISRQAREARAAWIAAQVDPGRGARP